ncbi:helix-turn-helix domain-containing protein [Streptomyces sp. NPDC005866]
MARSLEIVGERWTLLIIRDAFYGVRRFNDFIAHLNLPRAVLTNRLHSLVEENVLVRTKAASGRDEYTLTSKGESLWPVIRSLLDWGDTYCSDGAPRRLFVHALDNGELNLSGTCAACHQQVDIAETLVTPGPGLEDSEPTPDSITAALLHPRRMLSPFT